MFRSKDQMTVSPIEDLKSQLSKVESFDIKRGDVLLLADVIKMGLQGWRASGFYSFSTHTWLRASQSGARFPRFWWCRQRARIRFRSFTAFDLQAVSTVPLVGPFSHGPRTLLGASAYGSVSLGLYKPKGPRDVLKNCS